MDVHEAGAATDHIARARKLAPLLTAAAPRIDEARELPSDVLDAMHGEGMFRLLVPRSIGGAELDPATYIQCVEAIASGDASVAWCMNQGSGCSMSAGYLEPRVAHEVFGGDRDVLAWGMGPGAKAIRVEGGWRITGTWAFASGSRHATWLGAHCPCFEADGTPQRHPDGRPWERTMLFRRQIATIKDVWQVVGLRGTGSDTYSVQDLFVDDAHTLTRDRPDERREPGLIYRFAAMQIYASGFAAVALGGARAALEAFIDLARGKTPALTSSALRDSAVIQSAIGIADAKLKSARTWLIHVLRETQDAVQIAGELTTEQRIAIRQAATFAIHQAKEVVDVAYHEAGATAIFDANPFERRFRDVNTVTQQVQGRRSHFETVGQHLLGSQANLRWL
ncbi:MAG: acyl-CoA dehydrogenase family protein [Acetobacteraceae bacterium]|jgi:indole-3-acetate monooxygenase